MSSVGFHATFSNLFNLFDVLHVFSTLFGTKLNKILLSLPFHIEIYAQIYRNIYKMALHYEWRQFFWEKLENWIKAWFSLFFCRLQQEWEKSQSFLAEWGLLFDVRRNILRKLYFKKSNIEHITSQRQSHKENEVVFAINWISRRATEIFLGRCCWGWVNVFTEEKENLKSSKSQSHELDASADKSDLDFSF